jgi:hypothetical protein
VTDTASTERRPTPTSEAADSLPADIRSLHDQIEANTRDAHALVLGLTAEQGEWRAEPGSWSVAQCLDHLATSNRVYLGAMRAPAVQAREERRLRSGIAKPGLLGGLFVWSLEPPVKVAFRMKAPRKIKPQRSPPLADALAAFVASQQDMLAFLRESADLDLTHVRFPNPFVRGVRFSLATGFHVTAAHERRHLSQAWRVRRAAEQAR